jgi:hypothetical protein
MKSAHAYKSALYAGSSLDAGFWDGRAADRQARGGPRELSLYWIDEFLDSDLKATPAAGTKRLAVAIRKAIHESTDSAVRNELISATNLIGGRAGRRESPRQLFDSLGLSDNARDVVREALPREEILDEVFELDPEEFSAHVLYRFVELDNGATLVAENERFDQVFSHEDLPADDPRIRYSTEGQVVGQELRKSK